MRLRLPGLSELAALFVADSNVASALTSLQRAHGRLLKVIATQRTRANRFLAIKSDHLKEADRLDGEAARALNEATHAERVATRLSELCA